MEMVLHPCPEPGCPNLVRERHSRSARCDEHRVRSPYDADWRRVRAEHLTWFPWCRFCHAPATEVDHIIPVRSGGARLDHNNLRSLCVPCHRKITPREYSTRLPTYRRSHERVHRPR